MDIGSMYGPYQDRMDPEISAWFNSHKRAGCPKRHMCELGLRLLKSETDKAMGLPGDESLAADMGQFLQLSRGVQVRYESDRDFHARASAPAVAEYKLKVKKYQLENLLK